MRHQCKILVLSMLMLCGTSNSQLIRSCGIKIGPVVAGQDWTYSIPFGDVASKTRWGFDLGPFVEFLNIPMLSVLVEAHYVQRGFSDEFIVTTASDPTGIGTVTVSPRLDYLSIPLLAKVRVDVGPVSPYVVIGPRYDVLLSTKPEGFDAVLLNLKATDLGVTVGAGMEWAVAHSIRIGAEGRWSPGLQDVFRNPALTVRNRSFEFLLTTSMY